MDPITQQAVLAAAGAAGGDKVYVDDVFSTTLYTGNDVNGRQVPTGIDNTDKSLVWVKQRNDTYAALWYDSERGNGTHYLNSTNNASEGGYSSQGMQSFDANGFTVGNQNALNGSSSRNYVAWNFKAEPGFFDVVTYTGNGTAGRTISHSLASVPGMIIVKRTDASNSWNVFHRSLTGTHYLELETTGSAGAWDGAWNNTNPTSTHFTVGSSPTVNNNGGTYVAYIFAHEDASFGTDGDESIIKCGTFTSSSFTTNVDINLGFEPQFFLVKKSSGSGDWWMIDTMRGFCSDGGNGPQNKVIRANSSNQEGAEEYWRPTATGISGFPSGSSATYIYMAIRRPHKPPEAATEVFAIDTGNSSSTIPCFDSGFPVDFAFRRDNYASAGTNPRAQSRLQGARTLYPSQTYAEGSDSGGVWDSNEGWCKSEGSGSIAWMFKRAPGFMDVVAYNGDGITGRTVNHNLEVVPEFMIVKRRSGSENWYIYHKDPGATKSARFNTSPFSSSGVWNDTTPTATTIALLGDNAVNGSGETYIAYLFATLPGISKVGGYAGTGSALNIDCGFTNGARFVLVKRIDVSTGNWFLWDTTRGIVEGNDANLTLDLTNAQTTSSDRIDPLAAGFTLNGSYNGFNASGNNYIFLAIA
jgi:hypothetical protein